MLDVILALLPALFVASWFFGAYVFLLTGVTVLTAVVSEALWTRLMKKPSTVGDLSAALTGLLLAMNLPPDAPLWIGIIGAFLAIILIKQLFGGLGQNFMNPALGARVILLLAWTPIMTHWIAPQAGALLAGFWPAPETITGASPLALLKSIEAPDPGLWDLLLGNRPGSLGEAPSLALLVGAAYLAIRKVIDLRGPLIIVGITVIFGWIFGGSQGLFTGNPLLYAFSGSLILGAFFMATDYATAPGTPMGRLIYVVGIGFLTGLIRHFTNYPEGVSFAIILMNVASPLIERLTIPRSFGGSK